MTSPPPLLNEMRRIFATPSPRTSCPDEIAMTAPILCQTCMEAQALTALPNRRQSVGKHTMKHASTFPPRYRARVVGRSLPRDQKGAGNAGHEPHPHPRVPNGKAHERSHHRLSRKFTAFPTQWFYGFLRALPGVHDLLVTVACGLQRVGPVRADIAIRQT